LIASFKDLCTNSTNFKNLILMTIIWSFGTFSFFMLPNYFTLMKGNVYILQLSSEFGEFLANFFSLFLARLIDLRRGLLICLILVTVGSLIMQFVLEKDDRQEDHFNLQILFKYILAMTTYMGCVASFDINYMLNP